MTLTQTQKHYWTDRYALRDEKGNVVEDSIEDTWRRVANAIGDTPSERDDYYSVLEDFKFVPGGRILAGAGAESEKTFYNCYVIPVETRARRENRKPRDTLDLESPDGVYAFTIPPYQKDDGSDSREAIFDTINTMVGIMSRGGGVGINWSVLRPTQSYLVRVSGTSSGPVGWMDVASKAVGEVIQGGSRRGAAMFMLDVWHPDVLTFINAKRDNVKITNANVSVGVTDEFMEALSKDEDWTFIFPDTTHPEYDRTWDGDIKSWKARGLPVVKHGTVPSSEVWSALAEAAHASGEPGVIFLDRYNELSTANGEERIICVNPCGEQGLGAYSVCNLGAMNLYAYMRDGVAPRGREVPVPVGEPARRWFDLNEFSKDVRVAISFLDRVIDKTPDYLEETVDRQNRLRRIGLGVMGLADALVALGIRYGSPEAVSFTREVFRVMKDSAIESSIDLAKERGPAGAWHPSLWSRPYLKEYFMRKVRGKGVWPEPNLLETPLRNIFLLTQAPTGTTSLLANVNSGIEPYFNIATWREDRTGGRMITARAVEDVFGPTVEGTVPKWKDSDFVVTSSDVKIDEHIAMQAAVQQYVDSSVSKTINAPKEQTVDQTKRAFTRAYYSGLKGIAYYRDGSRDQQVLYHKNPNEVIKELQERIEELEAKSRMVYEGSPTVPASVMIDMLEPHSDPDRCPSCGGNGIAREEGCKKCYACGWSAC